jgi:hypothetical protein
MKAGKNEEVREMKEEGNTEIKKQATKKFFTSFQMKNLMSTNIYSNKCLSKKKNHEVGSLCGVLPWSLRNMAGKRAGYITFVVGVVKHELCLIVERITEKQNREQVHHNNKVF